MNGLNKQTSYTLAQENNVGTTKIYVSNMRDNSKNFNNTKLPQIRYRILKRNGKVILNRDSIMEDYENLSTKRNENLCKTNAGTKSPNQMLSNNRVDNDKLSGDAYDHQHPNDSDAVITLNLENQASVIRTYDFNKKQNCINFDLKKLAKMFCCSLREIKLILLKRESIMKEFNNFMLSKHKIKPRHIKLHREMSHIGEVLPEFKSKITKTCKTRIHMNKFARQYNYNSYNIPETIRGGNAKQNCPVDTSNTMEQISGLEKIELEIANILHSKGIDLNLKVDRTVNSYNEALMQLKLVEEYALLSDNYPAISLLTRLEDLMLQHISNT